MQDRFQNAQQEGSAIDEFGVGGVSQAGNKLGMKDTVDKSRDGEDEADERAGSADIQQGAVGEDGRTNQDEGAEGAVQVGEGNEKRIGGANVMVAASKEMTELVGEEDGHQGEGEGETGGEAERVFVKKSERAEKFVRREGLVPGISGGELRAGDEAGAKGEEEEEAS